MHFCESEESKLPVEILAREEPQNTKQTQKLKILKNNGKKETKKKVLKRQKKLDDKRAEIKDIYRNLFFV